MPTPVRRVTEREFVSAIDRWLDGEGWSCGDAAFRPCHGINVRLVQDGHVLACEGVSVVSRLPPAICELPPGTRTSNRAEARGLAAVAVRGDAGWYDGKPRKVRLGVEVVWNGLTYVHPS
ncbi:MAG: hypothetical protein ACHP9T_08440 [Caulobacterales bacterium]|jgi:hypothetical protein